MSERLDYHASCLQLDLDPPPLMPDHRPRYDDEEPLGVSFFRTTVEGDLSGLTLPRTFFGRSAITAASFHNTDLHDSTLCWNDFADVDFSAADLSNADLRASQFERVSFADCRLEGADLRLSDFEDCVFARAAMKGATLTRAQAQGLPLSDAQIAEINWVDEPGDEPDGG